MKRDPDTGFSCEYFKTFTNSFFYSTHLGAASVIICNFPWLSNKKYTFFSDQAKMSYVCPWLLYLAFFSPKYLVLEGFNHQPGMSEADLRKEGGGHALLIFYNHLFFCNQFEELQIVLFEVKLIINSLIYV